MNISPEGIALIQHYESCDLKSYKCPAGIWTIGWGHTGADVKPNMTISQATADALFEDDIKSFVRDVNILVKTRVTQRQFDALVSFAFNVGPDMDGDGIAEGLGDSTLLKYVNAGKFVEAANEFPKWNRGGGKKLLGLTRRRAAERALFLGQSFESAIRVGDAISCV